jgi:hypothetical protein
MGAITVSDDWDADRRQLGTLLPAGPDQNF